MKFRLVHRSEIRAEQARRRFWGGYVSKDDQRKQRREFKDGSTEGKPKSRRKPRSVDEMLREGDGES